MMSSSNRTDSQAKRTGIYSLPLFCFAAAGVLLFIFALLSLMIGPAWIGWSSIAGYVLNNSETIKDHVVLHILRVPRMLTVLLIGAALGVAGCIMQALTRNPLASPSVFGIHAGASFVIVLCTIHFPAINGLGLSAAGFAGGLLTVLLIVGMSAAIRGGRADIRMALIGVVIQALLSSFTQGLLIFNEESASRLLFWLAGSAAGVQWDEVYVLSICCGIGLLAAMFLGRSLSLISLGEEMARGLGQRIWTVRLIGTLIVVLLAGSAVAVVGPIGFVGLIVPHIARYLLGTDYRRLLPLSALLGAILLTMADVCSRFVNFPAETPVGIVTALIGAPYFVYLARRQSRRQA
ncbi:FecCD family ABC transporter permease [Paenibacillus sp. WLX1005]|uniref:FecCD family ABC transporter permease n=1 Tax=Paenibacillus sp. WLX1005 TaxID=3243766 RepID=UPI0039843B9C